MAGLFPLGLWAQSVSLVNHADTWRYRKGTSAPQANWKTVADAGLDGTWASGAGGFGYANNSAELAEVRTQLGDMRNAYTTFYIRKTFTLASAPDAAWHIYLTVDYDDGFIAWLDGEFLASGSISGAPAEPAYNATAGGNHESSRGNSSPNPPTTYDLGPVNGRLAPGEHVLALMALNDSPSSSDCILLADLAVGPFTCPPNTICEDMTWRAADSPHVVTTTLTVAAGATLTIEPGSTVLFAGGAGFEIHGRLLAEGTPEQRIRFARLDPNSAWGRIRILDSPDETRLAYCDIDGAGSSGNVFVENSSVYLDHVVFTNTTVQLVTLEHSSCTIQFCHFPSIQNNELLHFNGMPADGHALIATNLFGTPGIPATSGYNDIIDFTGGNRPGPIVEFLGNVFLSGVDDCFDMDGTDAHIEGNVFMNVMQDAPRSSSSSPITTGAAGGDTSELVICRNIFYNCEHTVLLKDRGTALIQNNTIVRLVANPEARSGSTIIPPGILLFGEPWRGVPAGAGAIWEGNIAADLDPTVQATPFPFYDPAQSFLVVNHSLIEGHPWPGEGNLSVDPGFVNPADIAYLNIWTNLALRPDSPCKGAGPNGLDMGAVVPPGASVSGAPEGVTTNTSAVIRVAGPGIFAYKWRTNDGPWSAEVPLTTSLAIQPNMFANARPIVLRNMADGDYRLEVIGKNSAGRWQSTNAPTIRTWTVRTREPLRIERIEHNDQGIVLHFNATAGQTYSVLRSDSLTPAHWVKLRNYTATADGEVTVTDPDDVERARFYELVSPALP